MTQTRCDIISLIWRNCAADVAQDETWAPAGVAVDTVDKPVCGPVIPLHLWLNCCWHAKELQLSQSHYWAPVIYCKLVNTTACSPDLDAFQICHIRVDLKAHRCRINAGFPSDENLSYDLSEHPPGSVTVTKAAPPSPHSCLLSEYPKSFHGTGWEQSHMTTVTSGPSSGDDYAAALRQLILHLSLSLGLLYTHAEITHCRHKHGHIARQIGVARWQYLYDCHLKLCRIAVDMDFPPG